MAGGRCCWLLLLLTLTTALTVTGALRVSPGLSAREDVAQDVAQEGSGAGGDVEEREDAALAVAEKKHGKSESKILESGGEWTAWRRSPSQAVLC